MKGLGSVAVAVGEGVSVGDPESVSLAVIDAVSVAESVAVGLGVRVSDGVRVFVPVSVAVGEGGTKQISSDVVTMHQYCAENEMHNWLAPP